MATPHLHSGRTVNWYMRQVLLAMLPGLITLSFYFGLSVFVNLVIASIAALCFEACILTLREQNIFSALKDCSAVITAWLIVASLPPTLSPLLILLGVFFAIVIGKQLYGGLGHTIFNPAMVGYVVILISFPWAVSQWPSFVDATTQATPLDLWHTQTRITWKLPWIFINITWLLGGLYLTIRKISAWQTTLGFLSGILFLTQANLGFEWSPEVLLFQLFSGGTMLAGFFVVTDPVTSPAASWGRFFFGLGIGLLTFCVRRWGGYPDGIAFSVLIMNCAVPLLDHYTIPRAFGQKLWWRRRK